MAAKTETSKQHNLKKIEKLTVSQLEESTTMDFIEADVTCISGLPMDWTQEYMFWSIDRSLRQILQHLENARITLLEQSMSESQDMTSSSISSDLMAQEVVQPCCYCNKAKHSTDYSISSGSSNNSSSLSYLSIFSEATTWQFQSMNVPVYPSKELSLSRSQGTSLPPFQLTDPEKPDLFHNLKALPPLQSPNPFILEPLNPYRQQEKTKDKRKNKINLVLDHESNSVSNKSLGPPRWVPLQLSPLIRGELEEHMSQKVYTLNEQTVPLPVQKSWDMLGNLMDVKGVPESETSQTQFSTPIPQNTEQSTNKSPDLSSFHLHMNTGMNAKLSRTEEENSQSFTLSKQLTSGDDPQVLTYKPLVISMGTPPSRNVAINVIQEETTLLKKDPKHVLELSIEQRVIGLPEKRIQPHKPQVTNVELTPKLPCSATERIKITPLALLQVMDSMGMIPESHSEVIESVGFFPKPPNEVEKASVAPQPPDQITESMQVTQPQAIDSKTVTSSLIQVTNNMKVTPAELCHVMESMGMINQLHPRAIESVGVTPRPQSVKTDTLYNNQLVKPEEMSSGPRHAVKETVKMTSATQHEAMESVNLVLGPQNQAMKQVKITPGPVHQNTMQMTSTPLNQVTDYRKVTPGALQATDFMKTISPVEPHIVEARGFTPGSQFQAANLTLVSTQPDALASSVIDPSGAVEFWSLPSKPPSQIMESGGMTLKPSDQYIPAPKVAPVAQGSPMGMIPPLKIVKSPDMIPQAVSQVKESLELPSGLQIQVQDSVGRTPEYQGTDYVSITQGMPYQVMDPSKPTLGHHSEASPRQSRKMLETMGLTPDRRPQMKNLLEMKQSHNQIMESVKTTPGSPDQDTKCIKTHQKPLHQATDSEVVPVVLSPQKVQYLGGDSEPQPKDMDSMDLSPGLQNVKSEKRILDPRLQSMKSIAIATDLVPEMVSYEQLNPAMESSDLGPERHWKNVKSEESTPIPQLQSEKSVQPASESRLPDVESVQLTVAPQLQSVQSAGLAPEPPFQSKKSVDFILSSQSQDVVSVHLALPQELKQDIKTVALTPGPPLGDTKSVDLVPKPCLPNTSSDKVGPVPLLEDMKTPQLIESMKVAECIPSTCLYTVKSLELSPNPSYHFTESEGLTQGHQVSEVGTTEAKLLPPDPCHQVEESVGLTQSSLGIVPPPLSQTSESMEMNSILYQDIHETRTLVVKEIRKPPKSQDTIEETVDLLPESEVQNMKDMLVPESQPLGEKSVPLNLEPCSEITKLPKITLKEENENTESVGLILPKVDDMQEAIPETYSETGALELSPRPRMQYEKSESLEQNLNCVELTSESSSLMVGSKPHVKDLISGSQLQEVKSRKMDPESQMQDEKSVNLTQQSAIGVVDPEKPKLQPGLQSLSLEESAEGTQSQTVKCVDLNLGPQQPSIKSGLTPGPQLQSVRLSKLSLGPVHQEEKPMHLISGSPHYGVKSDEMRSCSPVQDFRSTDIIPKLPELQSQQVKSVEVNLGPCLQDVRFSDLISEPEHQGFKYIQFIPGIPFQNRKAQGFIPEPFLQLNEESQVEDMRLDLPTEMSEFQGMKSMMPASELQYQGVMSEEVNPGLWQQDVKFSELTSGPKLQGVKFGEQTLESTFHAVNSLTPELGLHDHQLGKRTQMGPQDMKQAGLNSGPWLQDVKFFDSTPGTQLQGIKLSELNSGPQLECVKLSEMASQPARQRLKSQLLVQDIKHTTGTQLPSFKGEIPYKLVSEPQILNVQSMTVTSGIQLPSTYHHELIRRPQSQGMESELSQGPHLRYVKPMEQISVSKLEDMTSVELTSGPHLEDMKSMQLVPKSEPAQVKSMMVTPGLQAGDMKPQELTPGSKFNILKSELPPSGSQLDHLKSVVFTLGRCLEGIASTMISPSPRLEGMKSVKLIPGSKSQDLKTVDLARDIQAQDVNAMELKLGPKKQEKGSVPFTGETLLQVKPMAVPRGLQLQDSKPKDLTSHPQVQDTKFVEIIPCLKQHHLKSVDIARPQEIQVNFVDLAPTQYCQGMAPMDLTLEPGQDGQIPVNSPERKCVNFNQLMREFESKIMPPLESIPESKSQDIKPIELNSKVQSKARKSLELAPETVSQHVKAKEFKYEQQLQSMKSVKLTPGSQLYQVKTVAPTLEPQLQGVKTMELSKELQAGSTKSIQWLPIPEFFGEKLAGSNLRSQSQGTKCTELKPFTLRRGMKSSELTVRPKLQEAKPVEFNLEPQLQQKKTSTMPLAVELQQKNFTSTSAPPREGVKPVELNKEPWLGRIRSVKWKTGPEYQGAKFLGLNRRSQSQGVKSTEMKWFTQLGGKKSKIQGEKSMELNLGPQEHCVKTPELSPGPELQKGKIASSTSEPQPQSVETVELHHGPQPVNTKSIQWIPGPEFQGMKFLGLNLGSKSQSVKPTELMSPLHFGGMKPYEIALGPKLQGEKPMEFNLGPQVQCVETPAFSLGPDLQKGKKFSSTPEPQPQSVKTVELSHGPQRVNRKCTKWIPVPEIKVKKSILNPRSQSQDVMATVQSRDVKTSRLSTRPKLRGRQPAVSESDQEHQPHKFKPIDLKSELQLRSTKSCDSTTRSRLSDRKPMSLKPGFHSQDVKSSELTPRIQPQELKVLESSLGTQFQDGKSLFVQESQLPGVKYGILCQKPQLQKDEGIELKSERHYELALPTKSQGMKSEFNSEPQWQSVKCSNLTPETKSQYMKCSKLRPSSLSKGASFTDLTMETKIQSVKTDFKLRPQLQDTKSEPVLINPQEVKSVEFESSPQLQDLKYSRMIMGIKVQDIKSVNFSPGPCLEVKKSEVTPEEKLQGMKSIDFKPSPKLQGEKPDLTKGKKFSGMKSVELNSDPYFQDVKYSEQLMGLKLEGVKSKGQQLKSVKSEVVTETKPQGVKSTDFSSGPQTQDKKSEFVQRKMLQDKKFVQFGQKLHHVTPELTPETQLQNGEFVKLNSAPQLQDVKYSKLILEAKLQDIKSTEFSSGPHLQDKKSSEGIPGTTLQKEKLSGLMPQPLWQYAKSFQLPLNKVHDRKPLQLNSAPQLQDRKLSMLTPEIHLECMKPMAFNLGGKIQDVKYESTNLQTVDRMEVSDGSELQAVELPEVALDSTIHRVAPSEFNARHWQQDEKSHKPSQQPQFQNEKSTVFNTELPVQHIKPSDLGRECPGTQSLKFNLGPQSQGIKPSEVCTETKSADESSMEFKHEPQLLGRKSCEPCPGPQNHYQKFMAFNTGPQLQDVKSSELHHGPEVQSIKSKVFCPGPHLQSATSACIPNSSPQYINTTGCNSEPHLQGMDSSACIPGPNSQYINFVCNPGSHFHGMNSSASTSVPKLQCVNPSGFILEPHLQDVNYSPCTPAPNPQCINSECNLGLHMQGVNSYTSISGPQIQCENSTEYDPKPQLQDTNFCASILEPQIWYVNSIECNPKSRLQGMNSSVCTPGQKPQCVNSTGYNRGQGTKDMNSCTSIPGPQIQWIKSVGRNPKPHLQGVNSSVGTPGQKRQSSELNPGTEIQSKKSVIVNCGPHLQDLKSELIPGSTFLNTESTECNSGPQVQCMNFSELNPGLKLQSINSMEGKLGSHLQGIKHFELNSGTKVQSKRSESYSVPELQGIESIVFNSVQHLQDIKRELTQGTKFQGTTQKEFNSRPQVRGMNSSELDSRPKLQCLNSIKLSSGPQSQNMQTFDLTSGSEFQCINSVPLNSDPHLQGTKSSGLTLGAKFQGVPFLENQLGLQHQITQPVFTLEPQSNGVKSVVALPTLLLEDVKSPEISKQSLLCGMNSIKLTQAFELQDLKYEVFALEPGFQNLKSAQLKPGSQSQSVNSLGLNLCNSSQCVKSAFAPKSCFQDVKPTQLRLESQQQKFPLEWQGVKPMVLEPESTRKFLTGPALASVKFSSLVLEPQQQSSAFTPESKRQSVKHVKLSSASLPQTGKSGAFLQRSLFQSVKSGKQSPQTNDQITESSKVMHRRRHQSAQSGEMISKVRPQVPKLVNLSSVPISGSSKMTKELVHKSTETAEKSGRLTPKPAKRAMESSGMSLQLDLQVPQFVSLTPILSDQRSKSLELIPEKSYHVPETLELISQSWPQLKDFQEFHTKQVTESKSMTVDLKYHVAEVLGLTCEARLQEKEFLRMTPKPVSQETEYGERTPRPCPQEPVVASSEKRPQGEESVVLMSKSLHHVLDSASGMTPGQGDQIPEPESFTLKPWSQIEKSLKLYSKQTNQVVGSVESLELNSETWQQGEVPVMLTKPQKPTMTNPRISPIGSLDQKIKCPRVSPQPPDQVTEFARTQLQVAQSVGVTQAAPSKVSESVKVTPGPLLQVIKSEMMPELTSQMSEYSALTLKLQDESSSEFTPRFGLQTVKSKKLITEPTHHILETMEPSGFQVIKTVLIPKSLLQIAKSEKLAPSPSPQVVESLGVVTKPESEVMDCLNLLPRPHLQELVKPTELTPKSNSQINSIELTVQQPALLEEPTVLTHEQRLQAVKSIGIKTELPEVMEFEDLNQRQVCQNRDSEMLTPEDFQVENYLSRFIHSSSMSLISSSVKTPELECLQDSGMTEVSGALDMKNLRIDILKPAESCTDTLMIPSSALPLALYSQLSDKTSDMVETLHPEIREVDILAKDGTKKKHMEELEDSLQSYSPYPLKLPPDDLQAAPRGPIRSFLGRQRNIWENHAYRQRLPRKYLSSMLMLGNVLGTTMERKFYSQTGLSEGDHADICRSIQNLFGVPAELMKFSQSLLEKGPRTILHTSVVKNYIQRHILCHGLNKRTPLRMWTRSSTSSIIQQYSGTRLGIRKTSSKLTDIVQTITQHTPVMPDSCTGLQVPGLVKSESAFRIYYDREDSIPTEESKNSQSDSQTRIFESQHSLKSTYLSQVKTDFSEQFHMLKDLQLKIAAKLLRSQIPHNVPPPLSSGLVLKYPICLQCGRCSGFNCCHKLQPTLGPYLLIYPQLHLLSTPEGNGEIRLHLGFRLRTGKRPQGSKYRGRNRSDTRKTTVSPSQRKAKIYNPASKSPSRDFQSGSSQSPASVQVHIRQRQWGRHGVVGKSEIEESGHYEFCQVHCLSENGLENNQDEKWAKSSIKKTSDLKYPMKRLTKGLKTQNTKLYKDSRTTLENLSGELPDPLRRKKMETAETSTASSKRQPKKSSQPKFMQLLFQGLRQAFQTAHRIVAFVGQKPEARSRSDTVLPSRDNHPNPEARNCYLPEDSKGDSMASSPPKQEDILQETSDQCGKSQQPKRASPFQATVLQLPETTVSERDITIQTTSGIEPLSIIQNVQRTLKNLYIDEISSLESKNSLKSGAKFQAQERILPGVPLEKTLQSHFKEKHTHKDGNQHSMYRERALCTKLSDRSHRSPTRRKRGSSSERTLRSLNEKSHHSPSERRKPSSSRRSPGSPPRRSPGRPSRRSPGSPSRRSPRSPSRRLHKSQHSTDWRRPSPSDRSQHSLERCPSSLKRSHLSPTWKACHSLPEKSPSSLSERTSHSPPGIKRHSSSGRSHHSPSRVRSHRLSGKIHRSHSQRTHYSPSESRHSHSERSQHSHKERLHHSPKERRKHHSPQERSRHSLSKLGLKSYFSMPSTDHTKKPKSRASLEA